MPPPKETTTNDTKTTHTPTQSNPDIITTLIKECYYCKQKKDMCICDGTPFGKGGSASKVGKKERGGMTASSRNPVVMQNGEEDPRLKTGSMREG